MSTPVAGGTTIHAYPIGTRIRNRRHPELTGKIGGYEWNEPGVLSAIPYRIDWDSGSRAPDVLGWFYCWATHEGIEPLVPAPDQETHE